MADDPLYVLLRRALDDDGPEGKVAWGMFAKRAKGKPGHIFYMTEDYTNPLMFVVEQYEQRIAELERINAHLQSALNAAGVSPKKQKAKSFPWEKYPQVELEAFRMIFERRRPMAEVKDYVRDHAPEAEGNTTFINQRFIQGRPNNIPIEVKKGSGETSWSELWKIGTLSHADGWIQRVMRYGSGWEKFQQEGHVPKDWSRTDPNKFIDAAGRKNLRDLYHSNGFPAAGDELEGLVREAGADGITTEELKKMGIGGRRFDIRHRDVIFDEGGRWYHQSFGFQFPDNKKAAVAYSKFMDKLEELKLATPLKRDTVHGSEHRGRRRGAVSAAA